MSDQIPKLKLVIRQPPPPAANDITTAQKTFPFPMISPIDTSQSSTILLQNDNNKLRRRLLPAIESIPRGHWTDLSLLTRQAIGDSLESLETISEVYQFDSHIVFFKGSKKVSADGSGRAKETIDKLVFETAGNLSQTVGAVEVVTATDRLQIGGGIEDALFDHWIHIIREFESSLSNMRLNLRPLQIPFTHPRIPKAAISRAIAVLSSTWQERLPLEVQRIFRLESFGEPRPLEQLDRLLKLKLVQTKGENFTIHSMPKEGKVVLLFHRRVFVSLTLVPHASWFVLEAWESPEQPIDALTAMLQRRFNQNPYNPSNHSNLVDMTFVIECFLAIRHLHGLAREAVLLTAQKQIDLSLTWRSETELYLRLWPRHLESTAAPSVTLKVQISPEKSCVFSIQGQDCREWQSLWMIIEGMFEEYQNGLLSNLQQSLERLSIASEAAQKGVVVIWPSQACCLVVSVSMQTGRYRLATNHRQETLEEMETALNTNVEAFTRLLGKIRPSLQQGTILEAAALFATLPEPFEIYNRMIHQRCTFIRFLPLQHCFAVWDAAEASLTAMVGEFKRMGNRYRFVISEQMILREVTDLQQQRLLSLVHFYQEASMRQVGLLALRLDDSNRYDLLNVGVGLAVHSVQLQFDRQSRVWVCLNDLCMLPFESFPVCMGKVLGWIRDATAMLELQHYITDLFPQMTAIVDKWTLTITDSKEKMMITVSLESDGLQFTCTGIESTTASAFLKKYYGAGRLNPLPLLQLLA